MLLQDTDPYIHLWNKFAYISATFLAGRKKDRDKVTMILTCSGDDSKYKDCGEAGSFCWP